MRRLVGVACLVGVVFGSRLCVAADESQATALNAEAVAVLLELRDAFASRPPLRFHYATSYELVEGPVGTLASLREERTGEIRQDGLRMDEISADTRWDAKLQRLVPARRERRVYTDDRSIGLRTFVETDENAEHHQAYTYAARLHEHLRPDFSGWFADGVLFGSEHIADTLLRSAKRKVEVDQIPGEGEFLRIQGTAPEGSATLWTTRHPPYSLRRARFEAGWKYLDTLGDLSEASIDVRVTKTVVVGDYRIATAASAENTYVDLESGVRHVKLLTTRRHDVEIRPAFEELGAFRLELPENTVVTSYDVPKTRYVWKDGRLSPDVDVDMEPALDEAVAEAAANPRASASAASGRRPAPPAPSQAAADGSQDGGLAYSKLPWWEGFRLEYALAPDELVRNIELPRSKAAKKFIAHRGVDADSVVFCFWQDGKLVDHSVLGYADWESSAPIEHAVRSLSRLTLADFRVSPDLKKVRVAGDWSIENGANPDRLMAQLAAIFERRGVPVRVEAATGPRPVILISGTPAYHPIPEPPDGRGIYLYWKEAGGTTIASHHTNHFLDGLVKALADATHVAVEWAATEHPGPKIPGVIKVMESAVMEYGEADTPAGAAKLKGILAALSEQTGLQFELDRRPRIFWELSAAGE